MIYIISTDCCKSLLCSGSRVRGCVTCKKPLNVEYAYNQFVILNQSLNWRWSPKAMRTSGYEGTTKFECFLSYLAKEHKCTVVDFQETVV